MAPRPSRSAAPLTTCRAAWLAASPDRAGAPQDHPADVDLRRGRRPDHTIAPCAIRGSPACGARTLRARHHRGHAGEFATVRSHAPVCRSPARTSTCSTARSRGSRRSRAERARRRDHGPRQLPQSPAGRQETSRGRRICDQAASPRGGWATTAPHTAADLHLWGQRGVGARRACQRRAPTANFSARGLAQACGAAACSSCSSCAVTGAGRRSMPSRYARICGSSCATAARSTVSRRSSVAGSRSRPLVSRSLGVRQQARAASRRASTASSQRRAIQSSTRSSRRSRAT